MRGFANWVALRRSKRWPSTFSELLGERMRRRRESIQRVLEARAGQSPAVDAVTAAGHTANGQLTEQASMPEEQEQATQISSTLPARSHKRKMRMSAPVRSALVLAALALGTAGLWLTRPLWNAKKPTIAVAQIAAPAACATVTQEPQSAMPSPSRMLKIVANEPVAQLRIDGATIIVPEPVKQLDVPLAPQSRILIAVAADGRRVEAQLAPEQQQLDVSFPSRRRAPTPVLKMNKPPQTDGLAASPYGSK